MVLVTKKRIFPLTLIKNIDNKKTEKNEDNKNENGTKRL